VIVVQHNPAARQGSMNGYSDRINHALAFAAKHHDQRVRKGTRLPYLTQPANLAVILTRYGRDEESVTAAILLEVVSDHARQGFSREWLAQRIGEKFGARVLELALAATERRSDGDGADLSADERRADRLQRILDAEEAVQWLVAAEALHGSGTLLADLRRTVDASSVWSRLSSGRERTVSGYRLLHSRLVEVGFGAPIVAELGETVAALEHWPA
jgi:(p)ppGpp synthase/HD superfamily hydrolase